MVTNSKYSFAMIITENVLAGNNINIARSFHWQLQAFPRISLITSKEDTLISIFSTMSKILLNVKNLTGKDTR